MKVLYHGKEMELIEATDDEISFEKFTPLEIGIIKQMNLDTTKKIANNEQNVKKENNNE